MSAVDRAAEIIGAEFGPCNDTVNHDGREARWAAELLADAGLLVTDEIQAVLDTAVAYISGKDPEEMAERHVQFADAVYAHAAYLALREAS